MVFSENGIIKRAQEAKDSTIKGVSDEVSGIQGLAEEIENKITGDRKDVEIIRFTFCGNEIETIKGVTWRHLEHCSRMVKKDGSQGTVSYLIDDNGFVGGNIIKGSDAVGKYYEYVGLGGEKVSSDAEIVSGGVYRTIPETYEPCTMEPTRSLGSSEELNKYKFSIDNQQCVIYSGAGYWCLPDCSGGWNKGTVTMRVN